MLMVLDEFPVLGYMRTIEAAAGQIAGFGVKLWTIVQDITQLQRLYRDSWETFVANSGVVTAFANTDGSTLKYLSEHARQDHDGYREGQRRVGGAEARGRRISRRSRCAMTRCWRRTRLR